MPFTVSHQFLPSGMQAFHGTFTLTQLISAPREAVYQFFSDPRETRRLQPYVRDLHIDREEKIDGVQIIHFRAIEYVPILGGLLKQRNAIAATWRLTCYPEEMEATAYSKPGVHLAIRYTYTAVLQDQTQLQMYVQWRAPRLFRKVVAREARKAQAILLQRLAEHFE